MISEMGTFIDLLILAGLAWLMSRPSDLKCLRDLQENGKRVFAKVAGKLPPDTP